MVKSADGSNRITYSVRLKPDILTRLKHIAVDERKTIGELVEEGIELVMANRMKAQKTKRPAKN